MDSGKTVKRLGPGGCCLQQTALPNLGFGATVLYQTNHPTHVNNSIIAEPRHDFPRFTNRAMKRNALKWSHARGAECERLQQFPKQV